MKGFIQATEMKPITMAPERKLLRKLNLINFKPHRPTYAISLSGIDLDMNRSKYMR